MASTATISRYIQAFGVDPKESANAASCALDAADAGKRHALAAWRV
jgi:hypothetical protein